MKKGLLILLYIGLPFLLVAQNGENELKFQRQVWLQKQLTVPPSPEAASLGRYGENDFQVNKYTGGYTKTIPIYSIQGKELSWNIRLSYNPNGVKVDNMPGWVGLGWTLNAGGSVTRSVKGIPETKDNYFDKKDIIERYQNLPPAETDNDEDSAGPPEFQDYLYRVIDNTIELQPDNFYYNANSGGISGKYFIKYDKSIVQKQVGDVAIFPTYEPDMDVKSISIKDRNGTTYNFTIPEETQLRLADITGDPTPIQFSYDYNSTWHLSSVTNANQTEKLIFKYHTADAAYDLSQFINQHQYASKTYQNVTNQHNACPVENGTSANGGATSETSIKNRRHLKEIIYVLGTDTLERVLFTSVKNNCTYADATSRRLDRIRVQRGEHGAVGILDFDLTYNTTENGTCTEGRLLLQKIQEFQSSDLPRSNSTIERKEPYVFTYNNGAFPNPATTVSMDHWSFFNGNGGSSLVPNGIYPSCDKTDKAYNGGGDRRTDAVKIKTLVLNKIEYPTGGYTSLEIEPHLIAPYFCWENNEMYGGGLRIESISNYDCDGTLLTKKTYKYKQSNGSSSGKLLSPLQYDRPSIYKHFDEKNIGGGGIDYMCSKTVLSAINRSQIGATQDALVGYDVGGAGGINFSWHSFTGAANVIDVSKIYQTNIKVIP
jgi:hypothetical protein